MNEQLEKELNGKQDAEAMIHIINKVLESEKELENESRRNGIKK